MFTTSPSSKRTSRTRPPTTAVTREALSATGPAMSVTRRYDGDEGSEL